MAHLPETSQSTTAVAYDLLLGTCSSRDVEGIPELQVRPVMPAPDPRLTLGPSSTRCGSLMCDPQRSWCNLWSDGTNLARHGHRSMVDQLERSRQPAG